MNIKTAENILGVSYNPKDSCTALGRFYIFLVNLAMRKIRKELRSGKSIVSAIDTLSSNMKLDFHTKYHSKFKQLLRDYKKTRPSFIFYGDHNYTLEPLLYFMGLPEDKKKQFYADWKESRDAGIKLVGTDIFLLFFPEIEEIVIPVVLRDSDDQYKICTKDFVDNRRANRSKLSDKAIEEAARYLGQGNRSLMIFPQGYVGSDVYWKTGIIRIADKVIENSGKGSENVYLVPVSCPDLGEDDRKKIVARALGGVFGISRGRSFKINYGKPQSVQEFMEERIGAKESLDEIRAGMKHKAIQLEQEYYNWAGVGEPRTAGEKFPLRDLHRLLRGMLSFS